MAQTNEPPKEESSTFVRPKKQKDWRIIGIRIGVIAAVTVLVCLFVLRPMIIDGESMAPTYSGKGFTFAFLPYFKMYNPQRKQIVVLKYGDSRTFLLKRIIALPGDTIEISRGVVYVNDKPLDEPYVKNGCNWRYERHKVPHDKIFVLGDNRSMPMKEHKGGMIDKNRLAGVPIW